MFKILKNKSGFTLIDLIVSISIIIVITTITIANFRSGQVSGELNLAAQKLASDIRRAQGMAMSLKNLNTASADGGWGVYFKKDDESYSIYHDKDNNILCDSNCDNNSTDRESLIELPGKITIENIKIGSNNRSRGHITFLPPDPIMLMCGNNAAQCENEYPADMDKTAEITIGNGVSSKTITINKLGLIDIQ